MGRTLGNEGNTKYNIRERIASNIITLLKQSSYILRSAYNLIFVNK